MSGNYINAGILASIGTEYNDAVLVVENNNVGWAVLQVLLDVFIVNSSSNT